MKSVATTVNDGASAVLAAARRAVAATPEESDPETVLASDCGVPCLVVVRPVEGRSGYRVVLVADTSDLANVTRAARQNDRSGGGCRADSS